MQEPQSTYGDWLATQQKFWEIWLDFTRQTLTGAAASTGAAQASHEWPQTLTAWWESMASLAPPMVQDFAARLLNLSQAYFRLTEQFTGIGGRTALTPEQWLTGMRKTDFVREGETISERGARDIFAVWDLPLDTWRRTLSTLLPMPGDFLHAIQTEDMEHVPPALHERIDRFLAIPAVGYSREAQEQYQRLLRHLLDYQQALFDYSVAFSALAIRSSERFLKHLNEQVEPIDSLRKLYDIWVDACEEVYAEYVMSEEYSRLYGRMVNALVAVKHQGSLLVDEALDSMNMPTRREISTMQLRVQETRRSNHALRMEIESIKERLDAVIQRQGDETQSS